MGKPLNKQQKIAAMDQVWSLRRQGKPMHKIAEIVGISSQTVHEYLHTRAAEVSESLATKVAEMKALESDRLDYLAEQALEAWEASKENGVKDRTVTKRLYPKPGSDKAKRLDGGSLGGDALNGRSEYLDDDEDYDPESEPGLYLDADGEEVSAEERARLIADRAIAHASDEQTTPTTLEETRTREIRYQIGDPRYLAEARAASAAKADIWGLNAPKADPNATAVVIKVYEGGIDMTKEV